MNSRRLLLTLITVVGCLAALYCVSGVMMSGLKPVGAPASDSYSAANFAPPRVTTWPSTLDASASSQVAAPARRDAGAVLLDALHKRLDVPKAIKNEAVLTFKTPEAYRAFLNRAAAAGLVVKNKQDDLLSVRVGFGSMGNLFDDLAAHGADYAQLGANFPVQTPDLLRRDQPTGVGDVPYGAGMLGAIGAGPNVDRSDWGSGVTVAVLDSGVTDHPAFTPGQITHVDLVNDGQPFNGHGTAIASLIAGNLDGANGVAPAAQILDVRVADAGGASDSFTLASGIMTALHDGAQVINISMGSPGDAPVVAQAVQTALNQGVVVVASAGNEDLTTLDWPAAYPGVISVSGVDAAGHIAYFSNAGTPTLAAPSVGILSAYSVNNQPYLAEGDGTSQAAGLVSGAAAAITSAGGNVLNTLVKNAQIPAGSAATNVGAGVLFLPAGKP